MKRVGFLLGIVLVVLMLSACGPVDKLMGPPQPKIVANGKAFTFYQSSYCWGSTCADYAGPEIMLKDKEAEQVAANATITVDFKGKEPTELSLSIFREGIPSEVEIVDNSFKAPEAEGIYYYGLSAAWLRNKETRITEGSSSYVFALEVKGTEQ